MTTYITKYAKEQDLRIVDARKSFVLKVTKTDVESATQGNSKECAFARACKKQGGVKAAYFFRTKAFVEYQDRIVRYILPPSMQKEIVSFDRAKIMAPGIYQLTPPRKSSGMAAIRKRSAKQRRRRQFAATKTAKIKRPVVHRTQLVRTMAEP